MQFGSVHVINVSKQPESSLLSDWKLTTNHGSHFKSRVGCINLNITDHCDYYCLGLPTWAYSLLCLQPVFIYFWIPWCHTGDNMPMHVLLVITTSKLTWTVFPSRKLVYRVNLMWLECNMWLQLIFTVSHSISTLAIGRLMAGLTLLDDDRISCGPWNGILLLSL